MMKWSSGEIDILNKFGSFMFSAQLMKLLPGRTANSINNKCKRLSIKKIEELKSIHGKNTIGRPNENISYQYKLNQLTTIDDLDNTTFQILIGSLMGDGGIAKQNRNERYIFKETHGLAQYEYLQWKHHLLKTFSPSKISKNKICEFSTPSSPIFGKLRKEFYNKNKKAFIPLKYIEKLDELGLLIWYLDDGDNCNYPVITSSLFGFEDLEQSKNIINNKMGLNLSLSIKKKPRFGKYVKRLYLGAKNRDLIMPIWVKIAKNLNLPKCMWYKIRGLN
jgi:hypothetical protein